MFRLFRYGGSIRDTTIDTLGQSCPHTHTQKRFLDTFTSSSPVSLLGNGFLYLLKMAVFLLRVLQFSFTQPAASSSLFFVRLITERERERSGGQALCWTSHFDGLLCLCVYTLRGLPVWLLRVIPSITASSDTHFAYILWWWSTIFLFLMITMMMRGNRISNHHPQFVNHLFFMSPVTTQQI